jgi:acyl-CoA hydrolase
MEVSVVVEVEEKNNARRPLNRAHFVMVALDDQDRPAPAPRLILATEEEKLEWAAAEKRRAYRQRRRSES